MKLVVAEKPSVAQAIGKVIGAYQRKEGYLEGSGYLVSWCVGHLVGLAQPDRYDERYKKWSVRDLPIIPAPWAWVTFPDKERQFNTLKELMARKDVEELVCATDAGREGELIFRLVYQQCGCRKPFKRLWISSMEDVAILEGFANLKDGHQYDHLYEAALSRAKADWLVGINATRLFSSLYGKKLTVGRVQTPTLAMLVERNDQIQSFQKEKYFNVDLVSGNMLFVKEKIGSREEAAAVQNACADSVATVLNVKTEKESMAPPKLFDLTSLQRESNRLFGMTAQHTLDLLQGLYEKKLITYPRTDSRYITEDMAHSMNELLKMIPELFFFGKHASETPHIDQIICNAKVSDHHAILLTKEAAKGDSVSGEEWKLMALIAKQMICATEEKCEYKVQEVLICCTGEEFTAKGKAVEKDGWLTVYNAFRQQFCPKEKGKEDTEQMLDLKEGDTFQVKASVSEHYTSPPKHFTEDSLLSAMETAGNEDFLEGTEKKGLGTPATRAAIIEKLVASKYLQRRGKQLVPTEDGINLIKVMPEAIRSPKLTADWENELLQVERGERTADDFLQSICRMVEKLCVEHNEIPEEDRKRFEGKAASRKRLGDCPRCGAAVFEGNTNYYCSNRDCGFVIWKESRWLTGMRKKLTPVMAKSILETGRVHVTGLYSQRTGRNFDADLVMDDTGEGVRLHLDFGRHKAEGEHCETEQRRKRDNH